MPTLQSAKAMDQSGSTQSAIAAQEDKAAKVAALSQALVCIDKFKKSQEEKEDNRGGPNASEMNDFATHLQEASQGAGSGTGKTFPFVTSMGAKEQITDVLNKEQASISTKSLFKRAFCVSFSTLLSLIFPIVFLGVQGW